MVIENNTLEINTDSINSNLLETMIQILNTFFFIILCLQSKNS